MRHIRKKKILKLNKSNVFKMTIANATRHVLLFYYKQHEICTLAFFPSKKWTGDINLFFITIEKRTSCPPAPRAPSSEKKVK